MPTNATKPPSAAKKSFGFDHETGVELIDWLEGGSAGVTHYTGRFRI